MRDHHHSLDHGQVRKRLLALGPQALFFRREGDGELDTWGVRCFLVRRWPISNPEFYQEKSLTIAHHSGMDVNTFC